MSDQLIVTIFINILTLSLAQQSFSSNTSQDDTQVLYSYTTGTDIQGTCEAFLSAFAQQSSLFTKCLIENARPFRLCETCIGPYKTSITIFADLNADSDCYKEIVMADRVQVVKLVHNSMQFIWKTGNCHRCFSSVKEDKVNGTVNATLTDDTLQFLALFQNITNCLNTTIVDLEPWQDGNTSYCVGCKPFYKALNDHFTFMMDKSSSKVCMDVVDMMNYTRLMWSKTYNCSHRTSDSVPIFVIATFVCALPVIFYVVNRVTVEKTERTIVVQKRMKQSSRSYGSVSSSNQFPTTNTPTNTPTNINT